MAEATYSMSVNKGNNTMDMQVSGTFTPEKAEKFVKEYQRTVSTFKAEDFTLKCNCSDLDIVTQEMVPELENCFKMYKSSNFKVVEMGIKSKPILKMQLKRLGRSTGLTNLEVVEIY